MQMNGTSKAVFKLLLDWWSSFAAFALKNWRINTNKLQNGFPRPYPCIPLILLFRWNLVHVMILCWKEFLSKWNVCKYNSQYNIHISRNLDWKYCFTGIIPTKSLKLHGNKLRMELQICFHFFKVSRLELMISINCFCSTQRIGKIYLFSCLNDDKY